MRVGSPVRIEREEGLALALAWFPEPDYTRAIELGIPWPPARNDPCWCGSGRKYKRCCGR